MRSKLGDKCERLIEFVIVGTVILDWMDGFMVIFLFSPRRLILRVAGLKERRKRAGRSILRPIQIWFVDAEFEKITPACQANSPQPQIVDSSSTKAANLSSARTMKR